MARKRMIDPSIWSSFSFAELSSDTARLVFISLFSNADDEGRGIANPDYVSSITFPFDAHRRVADVSKALSEIALKTSTQFYQFEGRSFYQLTKWDKYQKIDRPSKSKFPPPLSVGEGGGVHSEGQFDEHSSNTRRGLVEGSSPKYNKNINIDPPISPLQGEGTDYKEVFYKAYPKLKPVRNDAQIDYQALLKAFELSAFLRGRYSMPWVCDNYDAIIRGDYADKEGTEEASRARESWYAERRAKAESAADKAKERAMQDSEYAQADKQVRMLAPKVAFERDASKRSQMEKELEEAEAARQARLKELGIDLQIHYYCEQCKDTGYLPNGKPCDCYKEI